MARYPAHQSTNDHRVRERPRLTFATLHIAGALAPLFLSGCSLNLPSRDNSVASRPSAGKSADGTDWDAIVRTIGSSKSAGKSAASSAAGLGKSSVNYAGRTLSRGGSWIVSAAGAATGGAVRSASNILPGGARTSEFAKGGGYDVVAAQPGPGGLCWPTTGHVTRGFSLAINHKGIDISAPTGTPVYAARTGQVAYAGSKLSGFGNVVIIEHNGGLATLYAHNSKMLVRAGQSVRQGQLIAEVGQTGDASGPHCHFELRYQTRPVDPRSYLP